MMRRRRGPGLMSTVARTAVIAGTANAVQHKQQEKWAGQAAEQQAQQAAQATPVAAPVAAPAAADPTIAQIQQLAALHAQGILNDEEFAAAKAKALGI